MKKIKIEISNSNTRNDFEYEFSYKSKNFCNDSESTPYTPSTPCLDDSLRDY